MKRKEFLPFILNGVLAAAFLPVPMLSHAQAPPASLPLEHGSGASTLLRAKEPGVVRIGVVLPGNHLAGKGELQDGEPLRAAEMQILHGPGIEAVALESILPQQAQQEAKSQGCDLLLFTSVTQQQSSDKPGRFHRLTGGQVLRLATSAAQFVPAVSGAAMLTQVVIASTLPQATALALTDAARTLRANADVTLSYKVISSEGAVLLADEEKTHTTADGENVLTALLTSMSAKVVAAIKP